MNRNRRTFVWLVALLAVVGARPCFGQGADVSRALKELRDPSPDVRMDAFYQLRQIGFSASDEIKLGLIGLLVNETAFAHSPTLLPESSGERHGEYFGDVIEAVASLHDP